MLLLLTIWTPITFEPQPRSSYQLSGLFWLCQKYIWRWHGQRLSYLVFKATGIHGHFTIWFSRILKSMLAYLFTGFSHLH